MKTLAIISSQYSFINNHFTEFVKITLPVLVLIILSMLSIIYFFSFFLFYFFQILIYIFTLKAIVNIHRFNILNDNKYYFALNKNFKELIWYFLYSVLTVIIIFLPMVLSLFGGIAVLAQADNALGFILVPLSFIWMIIAFGFFALNLPMAAIGKRIGFFKIFKLSKGFRITLILQFILMGAISALVRESLGLLEPVINIHILLMTLAIASVYLLTLFICCISKTYLLWEEKINYEPRNR
jgi:hypothetical protein